MQMLAHFGLGLLAVFGSASLPATSVAQESSWFARQSDWRGFERFHFTVLERPAYIVAPKEVAVGKPWVWRARFPGFHADMDVALLDQGFHVAYVDVAGMFGGPQAMRIGDAFYEYLTSKHGFASKPVLEGVSRGGLFVYNWAAKNPSKVSCIYCDTPVCDIKSWPGGKGQGLGAAREWEQCKAAYGFSEAEAMEFIGNPVDIVETIANAKIPLLHIVSESDVVVPPDENTYLLRDRLAKLGHPLEVISVVKGTEKSNGHHFDHPEPDRVVAFIAAHANGRMSLLTESKRVVLLGDSITYAGHHWAYFDTWLQTRSPDQRPVLINVGLPSETVSGLSEDGHAGGRFPRPDLAERLDRVLDVTQPDLVFACYGINCGIYQPFDRLRFEKYQRGIRNLKSRVEAANARLILITPPTFDSRQDKTFSYDAVMGRYSNWLISQRKHGWTVIDLHGPMARALTERREANDVFTFQPDGVHPDWGGSWFIASELIRWFGDSQAGTYDLAQLMFAARGASKEQFETIRERLELRRDAYLTAAGHTRPGVKPGMTIEQAEEQARLLTEKIRRPRETGTP